MRWLKLTLAYDGTNYAGWQFQPNQRSIQETLQATLKKITGAQIKTVASGRTDAGVHAWGQVVSLATDTRLTNHVLHRALNAELPDDIVVRAIEDAPEGFHAIRDATGKRYRYTIDDGPTPNVFGRRFAWRWHSRLDDAAMQRAAQALVGKHDFSSFESSGAARADSIRTVRAIVVGRGQGRAGGAEFGVWDSECGVTIDITADGFLYNMVRAITGTLVEVGRGAQPEDWSGEVLAARDRSAGGSTAPALGLCLMEVTYK